MLRCWLNQLEVPQSLPRFQQGMSDPKVPNTSDSESPTLVPHSNTKLESGPPSPSSNQSPIPLDGGRGTSDSDATTILEGQPPTRGPAASDAPTLLDVR